MMMNTFIETAVARGARQGTKSRSHGLPRRCAPRNDGYFVSAWRTTRGNSPVVIASEARQSTTSWIATSLTLLAMTVTTATGRLL
jgi:hypothetical protein